MIVYIIQQADFYQQTKIDRKIIDDRISKLYVKSLNETPLAHKKNADVLCNAAKDYSHILPWLQIYEKHGSLSIRTA